MSVRPSMAALITRVRQLIDDSSDAPQFDDAFVQGALDVRRMTVRYLELESSPSYAPGGAASYVDHFAPYGDWESDAQLVDQQYAVLAPTASDPLTGQWTTSVSAWPVFVSGKTYDVYGTAADLLDVWVMRLRCRVDIRSGTSEIKQSQEPALLMALAECYRAQQRPVVLTMGRSDVRA